MQCVRPVLLRPGRRNQITVPCGRCIGCRISEAREWALRCLHEYSYWENASFWTITYSDSNLPPGSSLDRYEFINFWKRLRKRLGHSIKYFGCGEYGEERGRPHYHAIIFGLAPGPKMEKLVCEVWGKGACKSGSVTYESCRYVADYVGKSLYGDLADLKYGDRVRPFRSISNGIGKQWALDNREQIVRQEYISLHGIKYSIPRYYHVLLKMGESKNVGFADEVKYRNRHRYCASKSFSLADSIKTKERTMEARINMFKKGM